MGGKPNKGTRADKRLKANRPKPKRPKSKAKRPSLKA